MGTGCVAMHVSMFLSDVYVIRSLVPRGKKKGDPKSSDRLFFCRRQDALERASIELEERKLALSQAQGTLERRSVLTTREITNNSFSINGSGTGGARELSRPAAGTKEKDRQLVFTLYRHMLSDESHSFHHLCYSCDQTVLVCVRMQYACSHTSWGFHAVAMSWTSYLQEKSRFASLNSTPTTLPFLRSINIFRLPSSIRFLRFLVRIHTHSSLSRR